MDNAHDANQTLLAAAILIGLAGSGQSYSMQSQPGLGPAMFAYNKIAAALDAYCGLINFLRS